MSQKLRKNLRDTALMALTVAVAAFVGSHTPQFYQKWKGVGRGGDFSEHVANQPERLTLYGTTTCPACITAREYLRSADVPFNDRLIDKTEAEKMMYLKLGEHSVPVLVSRNKVLVGFNREAYSEMAHAVR